MSAKEPTFKEIYQTLTGLEKGFVDALLIDPTNQTEALRKAGSKATRLRAAAHEMVKRPRVQAALAAARSEAANRMEITVDRVLKGLYDEATRYGSGSTHAARVQAWTQLGKHLGMFPTKITGTLHHNHTFEEALEEVFDDVDGDGDDAFDSPIPGGETEEA